MPSHWETARQASLDRKTKRQQDRINSTKGSGRYKYMNTTASEIGLPKPSDEGKSWIPPGGTFTGDSYFQRLTGIKVLETYDDGQPKPAPAPKPKPAPAVEEQAPQTRVEVATEAQARVEIKVREPDYSKADARAAADKDVPKKPKPMLRRQPGAKDDDSKQV